MTSFERLWYWITERESIRYQRETGAAKPWTKDKILQQFKFCNVRRMDDRVSQWLLKNWYQPNYGHPNMLLAATIARNLNTIDALNEIGFPKKWNPTRIEKVLHARERRGLKNFSGAYMITGRLNSSKVSQTVWNIANELKEKRIKPDTRSLRETAIRLVPLSGFSNFLAGQVAADLRWGLKGEWVDRWDWSARGPGSMRGLNRLHGREVRKLMSEEQFLCELREVITRGGNELPSTITRRLEAIDWQNCLCEYDKYERTRLGEGRPKQRYPGV